MSRFIIIAACLLLWGCEPTPCDEVCDTLAASCSGEVSECSGDCSDAESACEKCFNCLDAEGLCEIEPSGPCATDCTGCRGN